MSIKQNFYFKSFIFFYLFNRFNSICNYRHCVFLSGVSNFSIQLNTAFITLEKIVSLLAGCLLLRFTAKNYLSLDTIQFYCKHEYSVLFISWAFYAALMIIESVLKIKEVWFHILRSIVRTRNEL